MRLCLVAMFATGCGFELVPAGSTIDAPSSGDGSGSDAGIDGMGSCLPSEFPRCAGEDLEICDSKGQAMVMDCDYGCVATTPARCGVPVPSNGVDPAWIPGPPFGTGISAPAGVIIVADTDSGQVVRCGVGEIRPGGAGVIAGIDFRRVSSGSQDFGVFSFGSLDVASTGTLRLIGDVPGVLQTSGPLSIAGTVDLSGGALSCTVASACGIADNRRCSGPGPGLGGADSLDGDGVGRGLRGGVSVGTGAEYGGGGGGFGSIGGKGGGQDGGAIGIAYGTPTLTPLLAGSGGGGGRSGGSVTNGGGGGGGGVQLTSLSSISITGTIKASGAGGGYGNNTFGHGGGGGGSGGAILVEASSVVIVGFVTANGGGGGAGDALNSLTSPGQDGRGDATAAAGGTAPNAQAGGAGGAQITASGGRGLPASNMPTDGSGGGGGGVGRIYLRTRAGGLTLSGATVSPVPPAPGTDFLQ